MTEANATVYIGIKIDLEEFKKNFLSEKRINDFDWEDTQDIITAVETYQKENEVLEIVVHHESNPDFSEVDADKAEYDLIFGVQIVDQLEKVYHRKEFDLPNFDQIISKLEACKTLLGLKNPVKLHSFSVMYD